MAKPVNMVGIGKIALALGATAAIALTVPSAVFALGDNFPSAAIAEKEFAPFTPATVDPALARRVAENIQEKGLKVGFTPAGATNMRNNTVTVAIRVSDKTALSVQKVSAIAHNSHGAGKLAITPSHYNLGVARGYQSFVKAAAPLPVGAGTGTRNIEMPDLAEFKSGEGSKDKPSRFKARIALEENIPVGRSPRTLEGLGEQSVDLGGAYRITKNLDVTAGVRLSQERDRIRPLTDNVQDSQAVYVGTQFRF